MEGHMKKSARKIAGMLLCTVLLWIFCSCARVPADTETGTVTEENYRIEFNLARYKYTGVAEAISADDGTITIKDEGVYELCGTLTDGRLIIDAGKGKTVRLIFKNLNMTSSVSAPIFIKSADKVIIELDRDTKFSADENISLKTEAFERLYIFPHDL